MAQLTFQILVRNDANLPTDFGNQSRGFSAKYVDKVIQLVKRAEKDIPNKYWVEVPKAEAQRNDELFRDVRIQLRGQGVYDATMLTLLRRIRCKGDPTRAECAEKKE